MLILVDEECLQVPYAFLYYFEYVMIQLTYPQIILPHVKLELFFDYYETKGCILFTVDVLFVTAY